MSPVVGKDFQMAGFVLRQCWKFINKVCVVLPIQNEYKSSLTYNESLKISEFEFLEDRQSKLKILTGETDCHELLNNLNFNVLPRPNLQRFFRHKIVARILENIKQVRIYQTFSIPNVVQHLLKEMHSKLSLMIQIEVFEY